jgi:hypothetical protein
VHVGGTTLTLSTSVGVAVFSDEAPVSQTKFASFEQVGGAELMAHADKALYAAKRGGRDTFAVHGSAEERTRRRRASLSAAPQGKLACESRYRVPLGASRTGSSLAPGVPRSIPMRSLVSGFLFGCLVVLGVAALTTSTARSQIQAAPSYVPVGVSASGNTSTVWFHEPASRQAVACQTVGQGSAMSGIQCVSAKLP